MRKYIGLKWRLFKNSKFFLSTIMLTIGITGTITYYEGRDLFRAYDEAIQIFNMAEARMWRHDQDMAELVSTDSDLDPALVDDSVIGAESASSPEFLLAEFSAYSAEIGQTDADPFTMASWKKVYAGAIACPRHIPLGTKIEVEGLGEFTCEDRMNIRYTNNFDIFMEDKEDALNFGRKQLDYKIQSYAENLSIKRTMVRTPKS